MPHQDRIQKPIWRRALSTLGRLFLTAAFIAVAGGAVVGGRTLLADRAQAAPLANPAPAMPVETRRIALKDHHVADRRFSGQFEARQRTGLSFERPGTLDAVLVREGDAVSIGQVVARLDTRLLRAEETRLDASRASMAARLELSRRTNARQAELRARGFATEQTVDDTSLELVGLEADIAGIDAAREAVTIELSKAELRAPFAGIVDDRALDTGAVAAAGVPVLSLVETAPPRFRVVLDPALADLLVEGEDAVIDVDGMRLPGRLSRLAPSLDPMTRGRTVWFDVVIGPMPPDLTTGEVELTRRIDVAGAWVPLSALRPGPQGTWTLLVVKDGIVGVEAAEVLHLEGERAFVRGTFEDGTAYLPGGTNRVVPGQSVTISPVGAEPAPALPITSSEAVAWTR